TVVQTCALPIFLEITAVEARLVAYDEAVRSGAVPLFGEKYGDEVRVVDIGSSRERCGGTHVGRTGDIGLFRIVSESGVAAGIRRVEAVTGDVALERIQAEEAVLAGAAGMLKVPVVELPGKLEQMLEASRALEKELARLKSKIAAS